MGEAFMLNILLAVAVLQHCTTPNLAAEFEQRRERARQYASQLDQGAERDYQRAIGYCTVGDREACRSRAEQIRQSKKTRNQQSLAQSLAAIDSGEQQQRRTRPECF
jgi:hypothetical protein